MECRVSLFSLLFSLTRELMFVVVANRWKAMEAPNNHLATVTIDHKLQFTDKISFFGMKVRATQVLTEFSAPP